MIKALKFINEIINTFALAMGITLVVIGTLNIFAIETIIIIGICSLILNIGLSLTIKRMQKEKEQKDEEEHWKMVRRKICEEVLEEKMKDLGRWNTASLVREITSTVDCMIDELKNKEDER